MTQIVATKQYVSRECGKYTYICVCVCANRMRVKQNVRASQDKIIITTIICCLLNKLRRVVMQFCNNKNICLRHPPAHTAHKLYAHVDMLYWCTNSDLSAAWQIRNHRSDSVTFVSARRQQQQQQSQCARSVCHNSKRIKLQKTYAHIQI